MESLWDITAATEKQFASLNFMQTVGHDGGMHKAYEWTNKTMSIALYYDRGYFDCYIMSTIEPRNSIPLIVLLKYLNNNHHFYSRELEEAKLWNTLPTAGYFELFFNYYDKIKDFFEGYNIDKYNNIQLFLENKNAL